MKRGRFISFLVPAALLAAACGRTGAFEEDAGYFWDMPDMEVAPACTSDEECQNGQWCDGREVCEGGFCRQGIAPDCADDVDCTSDTCDEAADSCVHLANHTFCPPGQLCNAASGCYDPGVCDDDGDCSDGVFCNGQERCVTGACQGGTEPPCEDVIECTHDSCDEDRDACVNVPDDSLCEDRAFCDGPDICEPSIGCVPSYVDPCDDGDTCTSDLCNETSDSCSTTLRDEDGDLHVDERCGGDDCNDLDPNMHPGLEEQCRDSRDNDCDGLADCDDHADCDGDPRCGACVPSEVPEVTCDDNMDNDCDGAVDCDDGDCVCCVPVADFEIDCTNGRDDDCDGAVDCDDLDCLMSPDCFCIPTEPFETTCDDGVDNDCDGAADCDDGDCDCCVPTSFRESNCDNGVDEDCDGRVDCEDRDCRLDPACACVPTEDSEVTCDDGLDNDCDGRTDCMDGNCRNDPACCVPLSDVEMNCADGGDDDCDGAIDCDDADCEDSVHCCVPTGPESCHDGVDNDCDGWIDCDDSACFGDPGCCTATQVVETSCRDFIDNDCDGRTDCSDTTNCSSASECAGCWPEVCWDARDNDCDGAIDCEDSDCRGVPPCDECFPEVCGDREDNDCDGRIDCGDPDCFTDPLCADRNDTCTDAVDMGAGGTFTGTTLGYVNDYRGSCGGRGPDAVYYFILTATTCIEVDTFGTSWDTVLYVRRGHCITGTEVGCDDDTSGLQSYLRFDALPAGIYFVFVDGYGRSSAGPYTLTMSTCTTP